MKKGQRVRVLSTNDLGTIKDHVLMKKNGRTGKYCQVKLDKHPEQDSWFMDDQLGNVKETVSCSFQDESGFKLNVQFVLNHGDGSLTVTLEHLTNPIVKYLDRSLLGAMIVNFIKSQGDITNVKFTGIKRAS